MTTSIDDNHGYQILISNIKFGGKVLNSKIKDRPTDAVLDVPEGILRTKSDKQKFEDTIESFAYNTLSRKYGKEVSYCQVWLPLE